MIARKSFTFVPVGPVINNSLLILKAIYELFSSNSFFGLKFLFLIFDNVFWSIIAPALSSVPSIPSVSAAIATKEWIFKNSNWIARLRRYSEFLPPFPFEFFIVTEVSPPEKKPIFLFEFLIGLLFKKLLNSIYNILKLFFA